MIPAWLLIILIAVLAGWLAARGLVWILFHPRKPIKLFGIHVHGYFPARQGALALKLGNLIGTELTNTSDIAGKLADPGNFRKILPVVEEQVDQFLRVRMVEKMPMIGMLIGEKTIAELKTIFLAELETLFPVVMEQYLNSLQSDNAIETVVIHKIEGASVAKWETLLKVALSRELIALQVTGAIFGLIIGLVQVFALLLV